jgi:cytochrome b6-f complex iron-sulfur subunit
MSTPSNSSQPAKDATENLAENVMSRRGFAQILFTGVGLCYAGVIGYPIYRYLASPIEAEGEAESTAVSQVQLKDADQLSPSTALMFKFGAKPAVLIHHKDGTWSAMEAVCQHLGCTVQYQGDRDVITCACHGGVYDSHSGKNISGPPPRGLVPFTVSVQKGAVVVSKT